MSILVKILVFALITSVGISYWLIGAYKERGREIAALRKHIATLVVYSQTYKDQVESFAEALERIRADSVKQAEQLREAQTKAAKARAQSEARVQEILTAPVIDDARELVEWAGVEAQKLTDALRESE